MKKTVIIVTIIIAIGVAGIIGKTTYDKIYTARVNEEIENMGFNPDDYDIEPGTSPEEIRMIIEEQEKAKSLEGIEEIEENETPPASASASTQTNQVAVYTCQNDDAVSSRGYIVIHGTGGPDAHQNAIKNSVSLDPKFGGYLYFTYDANNETLSTIADRFVLAFNDFTKEGFDKIIIFGQSAGGVVASYTASKLTDTSKIEIHTLASPLNGYKFGSAAEQMATQLTGFNKEIALGFSPYGEPESNVHVYHHKTVSDTTLRSFCGSYASLCSPSVIQNNNVPGSFEFKYPNDTHDSIVDAVVKEVVSCRK